MNYLYDKRKKRFTRRYGLFGVIILIFLCTPILHLFYNIFETPITRAYTTVNETGAAIDTLVDTAQFSKQELLAYNQTLKNKLQQLEAEKEYHQRYLERFITVTENNNGVYADIVHRTVLDNDRFIINKGSSDGIEIGDSVVASDYFILGEVLEVFDHTSRVVMYTQKGQSHEGILFPHDIPVTVEGDNGAQYRMDIDRAVPVEVGDIVYQMSLPGYSMAVVHDIQFDPRDPFKTVILLPRVNIHELTYVQVIKKTTIES